MPQADGGDPGGLHSRPDDRAAGHQPREDRHVVRGFGKQAQPRTGGEGGDRFQGDARGSGRLIDPRMRDHREELVDRWPRDGPVLPASCQLCHDRERLRVMRAVLAVCIDEEVGVDGDQAGRS